MATILALKRRFSQQSGAVFAANRPSENSKNSILKFIYHYSTYGFLENRFRNSPSRSWIRLVHFA